jgi:peptidoglycan/xylan/chitin deacetylase (PgdA/CDA1 family)
MWGTLNLRRIVRRLWPSTIILCYHRVTELESDPQLLSVRPRYFAEHLAVLRDHYRVTRLQEVGAERHSLDSRNVIVTLDDGYADNFHEALPLLQAADCPATIFITAGKIGDVSEFWWDELEHIILKTAELPKELWLKIGDQDYVWHIAPAMAHDIDDQRWHVQLKQEPNARQVAYLDLCRLLRNVDEDERSRVLCEMRRWAGLDAAGRLSHQVLTSSELSSLASDGLVEIGAHTVNHPSLASLSTLAQRFEIAESKSMLEDFIGRPVLSFSYPFGWYDNFNSETVRLVREAGFDRACAGYPGLAHSQSHPYQLPRFLVRDWDGDEFARNLAAWAAA